jgi:hypothetical protein
MHICRALYWVQDLLRKMFYASSHGSSILWVPVAHSALERHTYSEAAQKQLQQQFGWDLNGHEK